MLDIYKIYSYLFGNASFVQYFVSVILISILHNNVVSGSTFPL